jgi:hypothetical protein
MARGKIEIDLLSIKGSAVVKELRNHGVIG